MVKLKLKASDRKHYFTVEKNRKSFMFYTVNFLFSCIAFIMSILNAFTSKWILFVATMAFSIICAINIVLYKKLIRIRYIITMIFAIQIFALMTYFIVSGDPDGFSLLWTSAVPLLLIPMYGMKVGGILSGAMLFELLFFFRCPVGLEMLRFDYSKEMLNWFPLYYSMVVIASMILEYIRHIMQSELMEGKTKSDYLYRHDALTGVMNRYGFNEIVDKYYYQNGHASIIVLDLDDFKNINDVYGHPVGDKVLQEAAKAIESVLCDCCSLCRWGGEEFAILMTCEHDAVETGERIRDSVENMVINTDVGDLRVTCSVGISVANDTSDVKIANAIVTADKCLYRAKQQVKNQVVYEYI